MTRREIPIKEYEKMWEKMKGKTRFETPHIEPVFKKMTVGGLSGPGTDFKNEYERLEHEHFNPPMPRRIYVHEIDDIIEYVPKGKR